MGSGFNAFPSGVKSVLDNSELFEHLLVRNDDGSAERSQGEEMGDLHDSDGRERVEWRREGGMGEGGVQ